jgi:SAM-dependent methyltransferase
MHPVAEYTPFRTLEEINEVIDKVHQEGWMYGQPQKNEPPSIRGRHGCGSDKPPFTERWCEALSTGIGSKLKDGLSILDLGCGYGRFLNYLYIKKINKFKYYGLEIPGDKNGDVLIKCNKEKYEPFNNSDKKIRFGFVDDEDLVNEAIENCDTLLLGSVFTHLSIEDSILIIKKYEKILEKENGSIVFSLIMGGDYKLAGTAYDCTRAYAHSIYTKKELEKLTINNKYKIKEVCEFKTDHEYIHTIYELII